MISENNGDSIKSKKDVNETKNIMGLGEGKYSMPDDIDATNDEIASMFYGDDNPCMENEADKKNIQISKAEFLLSPEEYLKRAETEDVFIMEGKCQKVAIVSADKYNAYRPVGHEFDWYNWK